MSIHERCPVSDSSARQLLVVYPSNRIAMTDDALDALIYKFFKVDPPSLPARAISADSILGAAYTLYNMSKPVNSLEVHRALKPLRKLMQGLITEELAQVVLPELGIYSENDAKLANLTTVDGPFYTNVVYAAHPGDPSYFIPLADFHRFLEEEKRAEFMRLAASLGAKTLRMLDANSQSNRGSIQAKVENSPIGGAAAAGAGNSQSFEISADFEATDSPPVVPANLRWLRLEPLWVAMTEARIKHGAASYRTAFEYSRDFNVTAELCAKVEGIGFTAGGKFQGLHTVRQEYQIEFFPLRGRRGSRAPATL